MGRSFGSPSWNSGSRNRHSRQAISRALWDLSSALGRLAFAAVVLVLIVALLHQFPAMEDRVLRILPKPVADFFREGTTAPLGFEKNEGTRSRLPGGAFNKSPRQPGEDKARLTAFGVGSTKGDVQAIQGTPTRRTDSTWYYGQSEVYFVSDRVVGWQDSAANPLQVR